MTDYNLKIAAAGDDGGGFSSGSWFSNSQSNIAFGDAGGTNYWSFFRFAAVAIPKDAVVSSAVLRFHAGVSRSGDTVRVGISIEDADNPAAPTGGPDMIGRDLGTKADWDFTTNWTAGNSYDSIDFSAILETHFGRVGWDTGQALTIHIYDDGSSTDARQEPKSYDSSTVECAELRVTYTTLDAEVLSEIGFSDAIDAQDMYGGTSEGLGLSDEIDAFNTSGYLDEGLGIDDAVDALKESQAATAEGFGLSDAIDASPEWHASVDDILGLADEIDAFNWSAWIRQNASQQVARFIFTLTGAPDGVADAEIKISSFNARKRTGEATYLSVVVPSYNYSAQISARANGEMVIEMAYEVDGAIVLREEILRATLETIRPDQGPLNRSITLTGHKTDSYLPQLVTLVKPTYYSLQSEKRCIDF